MRQVLANNKILLISIGIAVAYFPLEAAVDAFVFHDGGFMERLYPSDAHDGWMRLLPICLMVAFGLYAQLAVKRHRRVESALRESEKQSRAMFEQAAVGIAMTDSSTGRFLSVNQKHGDLVGLAPEALIGMTFLEITHPDDLEADLANMERLRRGDISEFSLEKRFLHKDGTPVWVNLTVTPVWQVGEKPRYHIAVVEDISKRKETEAQRARLATAIDQAAEAVLITDRAGTIQYVNPAFEKISGYTRQEALGQTPRVNKSGKHEASFYKSLWDTITRDKTWKGRFINRKKDGTLYEEEAAISPVHDAAGTITNFVAVKRDVTREVALEAQLRQAQRMEAIGQLASGIAHDFNNLLTAITGYVSLARSSLPNDHKALGSLRGIEEAADQATGTTRGLLTFSHNMVMEKGPVELNELFGRSVRMLRRMLPANIDIVAELDGESAWVRADGTQLQQVVINLAINARDAMPDGGIVRISVSDASASEGRLIQPDPGSVSDSIDGAVCLVVSDTGTGMLPEVQEHIFDPFFTTKPREQGTGLGLAITYGILKDHGGVITAESELGRGSTFTVVLPALGQRAMADTDQLSLGSAAKMGQSEMILLAEGDRHVRGIIAEALRSFGYVLLEATEGDSATKTFERHRSKIQLLVIDIDLSGASGHDWLRRIRDDGTRTPAILIAGEVNSDLEDQLDEDTFLLHKPFQMSELGVLVGRVISGMRREEAPS